MTISNIGITKVLIQLNKLNFEDIQLVVYVRVKYFIHDEKSFLLEWKRREVDTELENLARLGYPLLLTEKQKESLKASWKYIDSIPFYELLDDDPG